MRIKHLSLHNYRNYLQLELDLDPGLNLFIGNNAQGKTNLLEACHVMATARSHRTHRDSELIQWEQQSYHIGAILGTRHGTEHLELHYDPHQGKKVQLNGVLQPRLLDLIGHLKLVFFAPEHLNLVKGEPGQRRRFLDMLLSQLYHKYLYELSQYNRVLREKSNLLKNDICDLQLLGVYNQQLASLGASLLQRRALAIEQLAPLAKRYHQELHPQEDLQLGYESQIELQPPYEQNAIRRSLEQLLRQKQPEELRRRMCLAGLQRDDLSLTLNNEDAKRYASQGQQRSIVLALKTAEAHYMDQICDERPVLILDDLFSELDMERQANLLRSLHGFGQTLISATHLPPVLHSQKKSIFQVQQGRVCLIEN